ncbi:MAG: thiamine pyrophosphate-binding protein, partial [Verrucomicrobiota bacterium]
MTKSEELAEIVIDRCLEIGITEFVVCAGSRNSPLVLDILSLGDEVRVWSFFEERCAGFFALGRSRALEKPVAIVTTSGTAAAELLPAVIEAHYQAVPILCITADRPKSFRGTGAPQAIEQLNLYGDYVVASWDIEADFIVAGYDGAGVFWDDGDRFHLWKDWNGGGPAHLNVCFDEPLLSSERTPRKRSGIRQNSVEWPKDVAADETLASSATIPAEGLLVIVGALTPRQRLLVSKFLNNHWDVLVLADATSGLLSPRPQNQFILGGERILKQWIPKAVLRIGGVPSFRFWRDLEYLPEIPVTSVLCGGFSGLSRSSEILDTLD